MLKIISGGEAGAERGAISAACKLRVFEGGHCPEDRLAEDGVIPVAYKLTPERGSSDWNAINSDSTLIFIDEMSAEFHQIVDLCHSWDKPCSIININEPIPKLELDGIVNITGATESEYPGIAKLVENAIIQNHLHYQAVKDPTVCQNCPEYKLDKLNGKTAGCHNTKEFLNDFFQEEPPAQCKMKQEHSLYKQKNGNDDCNNKTTTTNQIIKKEVYKNRYNPYFEEILEKAEKNMKGKSDKEINKFVYDCICAESETLEELLEFAAEFMNLTRSKEIRFVTGDEYIGQLLFVNAAYNATNDESVSFLLDELGCVFKDNPPFCNRIAAFLKEYNEILNIPITDEDYENSHRTLSLPLHWGQ